MNVDRGFPKRISLATVAEERGAFALRAAGRRDEMILPWAGFKSEKGAQIAAFFAASSARDGMRLEKLKLNKLMYLAERRCLETSDIPMLYDEFYSLPHGPICSNVMDCIGGKLHRQIWSRYISVSGNAVTGCMSLNRDNYDELSDFEFALLNDIWLNFGPMTSAQIRNYTHRNCPEYTETGKSRIPIRYQDIFAALGREDAAELDHDISSFRRARIALSA